MVRPPEETPVKHTTPFGPMCSMASNTKRRHPGALDHDIGVLHGVLHRAGVIRGSERGDELGLETGGDLVDDVHLHPPLPADHGGQQTDRARPGDHRGRRLPVRPTADAVDLLPRLGHDGGRVRAAPPEVPASGSIFTTKSSGDAVALRAVAVVFLDAALGVLAVACRNPTRLRRSWHTGRGRDGARCRRRGRRSQPLPLPARRGRGPGTRVRG